MLRKMKKTVSGISMKVGALGFMGLLSVTPSVAFAERILQTQGTYIQTSTNVWILALKAILFLAGLAAILFSAWHLLQDYVLAKSDHEKKFSGGKLLVGAIVGSVLCYPGGAALIGGDFTGAGAADATVNQSDFARDDG